MERFQEALGRAQFRAKGKWYLAQEVDSLLEELSVCLEEDGREREALEGEARSLRQENARLAQEVLRNGQMAGTGDGQELRQALDQAQQDG